MEQVAMLRCGMRMHEKYSYVAAHRVDDAMARRVCICAAINVGLTTGVQGKTGC